MEEDAPVISFSPDGSDGSRDGRIEGGTARRTTGEAEGDPGREGEKLSGMNNGWRILRDRVKTLIMDGTQLEGARKRLGRNLPEERRTARKWRLFRVWPTFG